MRDCAWSGHNADAFRSWLSQISQHVAESSTEGGFLCIWRRASEQRRRR